MADSPEPARTADAAFRPRLDAVLAAASDDVLTRLGTIAAAVPPRGDTVIITVFVDQDAEGPFDVMARADGPHAWELDRELDPIRALFGVEWGEDGWDPEVPGRPRGWSREQFTEVVCDAVADWLDPLIRATTGEAVGAARDATAPLSWVLTTPDEYDLRPLAADGPLSSEDDGNSTRAR
ncbi:MAG: DUF6389 family protein [Mycetocola sp.]